MNNNEIYEEANTTTVSKESNKFNVGDIVEVVRVVFGDEGKYIGSVGKILGVTAVDDKFVYEIELPNDTTIFLWEGSLEKYTEKPKVEYVTKIKTIQEGAGHWESFDERVNEFMQDKDVIDVSHSFVTDIRGLENIIAVIAYRCNKTEEE